MNFDLLKLIEKFFGEKVASTFALVIVWLFLMFLIYLFITPNNVCDGPCWKKIDFGGYGGNPQRSYEEIYYEP